MLRALTFAIKIGLLAAAVIWVANRPGSVEMHWLGYDVSAHVGVVLALLLVVLALSLAVYRFVLMLASLPRALRQRIEERRRAKGYRSLSLGLTAVAAGDTKQASFHAGRAQRYMPDDRGLPLLLAAQAARLKGDDTAAQSYFRQLLEQKDTAFLGLRGLLLGAIESHDTARALELARQAYRMHPRQPWVLRMAYDLELRGRNWDAAQKILKSAVRYGALDKDKAQSDAVAIALQQAEDALHTGQDNLALAKMKLAHKTDPSFVPAAVRLSQFYIDRNKKRSAVPVIEKTWKQQPHPELAMLWAEVMPKKAARQASSRLQWFERLVALRPDSPYGQIAAAEEALEHNLWGAAQQYLERAQDLKPSARVYRLRARLAQAQDRPEEANLMLRKASEAPASPVWTCRETGRVYEHWSPTAPPQGGFNTIVWGYPQVHVADRAVSDRTELLITAPLRR